MEERLCCKCHKAPVVRKGRCVEYKLWGLQERFRQRQLYRDRLIMAQQELDKELAKLRKEIASYDA